MYNRQVLIDVFEERGWLNLMNKKLICALLSVCLIWTFVGCSNGLLGVFTGDQTQEQSPQYIPPVGGGDGDGGEESTSGSTVSSNIENPFINAEKYPVSKVSLNASSASYSYFRSLVNKNYTLSQLQKCSYDFKIEEFLNYFDFEAAPPAGDNLFGIGTSLIDCPWNTDSALVRFTFNTRDVEKQSSNNFVFHIDVTESMARDDVLPLFKTSFAYFVNGLGANDKVSIVLCSGEETVLVDGLSVTQKSELIEAVDSITVSNRTGNSVGLEAVYETARKHYIEGGTNRVILVSDGDISDKLCDKIEESVSDGIYTSVLAFGDGNHRNYKLESLAASGGGRYYYIDCESQGKTVMGKEIFKPTISLLENAIIELDFDSEYISEYRLIGYVYHGEIDNQQSAVAPSGKIHAGDSVTVCYEVKFVDGEIYENIDFASLKVEYTRLRDNIKKSQTTVVSTDIYKTQPDEDMLFMTAVIRSVMVLQGSEYIGKLTLGNILAELEKLDLEDYPERDEFRSLISKIVTGSKK